MSAIDRAFIKAYGDHPGQTAPPADASAHPTDIPDNLKQTTSQPHERGDSPKRSANRTKRSAAAAAVRAAEPATIAVSVIPQTQNVVATNARTTGPTTLQTARPKMVVGRQALRKLAENAIVPAPHTEFSKHQSNGPDPARQGRKVSVEETPSTSVARTMPEQPSTGAPPDLQHETMSREESISQRLRVDPPAKLARPQQSKFSNSPAGSAAAVPASAHRQLSAVARPASINSTPDDCEHLPIVGLEVDSFLWPPAVQALLECASSDFESIASLVCEEAASGNQVIGIVAIESGHGATTIALCLAKVLGMRDLRVCLIDGDFQRPRLAETVGLEPEQGLETALPGRTKLDEVLVESLDDRVTLLPLCSPIVADEIARSKLRLTAAFGELRERFDVLLVDAGHMSASSIRKQNIVETGLIDLALLVGRSNCDTVAWQRSHQELKNMHLACMGAIENRCTA